jgi:hypothetical protein
MRRICFLIVCFFYISLISCDKEEQVTITFKPTDHPISQLLGDFLRLTIRPPNDGYYSFSADTNQLISVGDDFYDYYVPRNEMKEICKNLSDTNIFSWEFMTAASPYPKDECELLIYNGVTQSGKHINSMCSIGKGEYAAEVIKKLSGSLTGDSKMGFEEIIDKILSD